MSTNANIRRRISSCNDLGESLLHAHSDAHVLPAVQDTLDRVTSQEPYLAFTVICRWIIQTISCVVLMNRL